MMIAISAGLYLPDLARFRAATKGAYVSEYANGRLEPGFHEWEWRRSPEQQREEALFALEFASGVALQIEERISVEQFLDPYVKLRIAKQQEAEDNGRVPTAGDKNQSP